MVQGKLSQLVDFDVLLLSQRAVLFCPLDLNKIDFTELQLIRAHQPSWNVRL
jgi:hypothetical protein